MHSLNGRDFQGKVFQTYFRLHKHLFKGAFEVNDCIPVSMIPFLWGLTKEWESILRQQELSLYQTACNGGGQYQDTKLVSESGGQSLYGYLLCLWQGWS